jgi:hypothetical protein
MTISRFAGPFHITLRRIGGKLFYSWDNGYFTLCGQFHITVRRVGGKISAHMIKQSFHALWDHFTLHLEG